MSHIEILRKFSFSAKYNRPVVCVNASFLTMHQLLLELGSSATIDEDNGEKYLRIKYNNGEKDLLIFPTFEIFDGFKEF